MSRRDHLGSRPPSGDISGDQGAKVVDHKDDIWRRVAEQDEQRAPTIGPLAEAALVGAAEADEHWLDPDDWGPLDYSTETLLPEVS